MAGSDAHKNGRMMDWLDWLTGLATLAVLLLALRQPLHRPDKKE